MPLLLTSYVTLLALCAAWADLVAAQAFNVTFVNDFLRTLDSMGFTNFTTLVAQVTNDGATSFATYLSEPSTHKTLFVPNNDACESSIFCCLCYGLTLVILQSPNLVSTSSQATFSQTTLSFYPLFFFIICSMVPGPKINSLAVSQTASCRLSFRVMTSSFSRITPRR